MNPSTEAARSILGIYRLYGCSSELYQDADDATVDELFEAVITAIDDCGTLKMQLPYNEFVRPSREVLACDPGWVGHFEDRDNRRFFLSDVHDYLNLFFKN